MFIRGWLHGFLVEGVTVRAICNQDRGVCICGRGDSLVVGLALSENKDLPGLCSRS